MIQTDETFLETTKKQQGEAGYIYVQVEQYGFDEYINVVVQPRGKFEAVSKGARVFENVKFSTIFYIPAEDDILI